MRSIKTRQTEVSKDVQVVLFTKKQFLALLKAVYLGNWMANAWRIEDTVNDYESIQDYVFSQAPRFGLDRYHDHDPTDGEKHYPTYLFEEKTDVHELHDDYDENTFWNELVSRLAERNLLESYTAKQLATMNSDELFSLHQSFEEQISNELEKHGLKRLRIIGDKSKK